MPHTPDPNDEPTGLAAGPGPTPPGLDDGTLIGAPPSPTPEPGRSAPAEDEPKSEASHRFETPSDREGEQEK